jgi:hypothetical protein
MRPIAAVLAMGLLSCSSAAADEASDKACVVAATSRHEATRGAIKATRILDFPPVAGFKDDKTSRKVEIDANSGSQHVTYIYVCINEPGKESVIQLMGIR